MENTNMEKVEKIEDAEIVSEQSEAKQTKQDKEFVIKEGVLNAVLNYLASKSYIEVAGLIQALSQSKLV